MKREERRLLSAASALALLCALLALFVASTSSPRYATNFWTDTNLYFTIGRGMREGLMPYAEVVLGSKRLCLSARRVTVLAFLAATASTLLAFYLTFVGAYSVLTPLSLLVYLLLWSLSVLVDGMLSDRY